MSPMLRSPKHEEEQQVPDEQSHDDRRQETIDDIMEGLEGFLDVDEDESEERSFIGCWDELMEWEEFAAKEEELGSNVVVVKSELHNHSVGFWDEVDEDNNRLCLNLNLNYQEVMDAWSQSHRASHWARHHHCSLSNANYYMGEVPVMEGERSNRREASVLRYKEKRQSRLFSKKIRYQVRKLNADKRPRLKGRFVKRGGSEIR